MVVSRRRFSTLTDFGIGVDCIYFDVDLGCALGLGARSHFAGVNCGSGVPTQNGVALYLYVEKAGQNGCQNRVTARMPDFFNCVECTNAQYSISLITATDSSASTGFDFDFRVGCTLGTSLECTGR